MFRIEVFPYGNVSRAASEGRRNTGYAHYHEPVDTTSSFVVTKGHFVSILLIKNCLIGRGLRPQKLLQAHVGVAEVCKTRVVGRKAPLLTSSTSSYTPGEWQRDFYHPDSMFHRLVGNTVVCFFLVAPLLDVEALTSLCPVDRISL